MTYSKPEVTKLASSLKAIQGGEKEVPFYGDIPERFFATQPAYQADE